MILALKQAEKAASLGEVPVGAVIVKKGVIISKAYNRREIGKNALYHAEILAINKACKKLNGWRLCECDMYVTLEPCPMCAGAIINSRIQNVYVGARDEKMGSFGNICDLSKIKFNHNPNVEFGLLEDESKKILKDFFVKLREEKTLKFKKL